MPGFIVTYQPNPDMSALDDGSGVDSPGAGITISQDGVEAITTRHKKIVLLDGYVLGSLEDAINALVDEDDAFLARLHGHYCALVIHPGGEMRGYCDRCGARTLFWTTGDTREVVVSSRWEGVPKSGRPWDDCGLGEAMRYRWTTGQATLLSGVSTLPHWHRVIFRPDGDIRVQETGQALDWPIRYPVRSFREKADESRRALRDAMEDVAGEVDSVAVLLSGGVDSALLAALAARTFKNCLLVSIQFPGDANPELDVARAFAETLGLEHLLVPFDVARVDADLRDLVQAKGGQINFLSLAMRQMLEAIPAAYPVVVYGEAADILFGSARFRNTETRLRRKRYADQLPAAVCRSMSRVPSRRIGKLAGLKNMDIVDAVLKLYQIPYSADSMAIVSDLCPSSLDSIYLHRAVARHQAQGDAALRGPSLRALLQDVSFRSNIANHLRETELSAQRAGKMLFSPFMALPVIDAARTLTMQQFYGGRYVKPVLRELACEHYDRRLIYREKHGFEVPQTAWLQGPLRGRVEAARRERELFDGQLLRDLEVDKDYSLFWSLSNWQLVNEQVSGKDPGPEQNHASAFASASGSRSVCGSTPSFPAGRAPGH